MAKFKVEIKVGAVIKTLNKALKNTKRKKSLLKDIGEFVVNRIVAFARSGKNAKTGRALPKLSESYQQMRVGAVHFRKTKSGRTVPIQGPDPRLKDIDGEFFRPGTARSNLTFTGKLLRSFKVLVKRNKLFILIGENRTDGKKNKDIIGHLEDINKGYDFIGLDKKGRKRVRKMVLDELRRELRRNNLKK